MSHRGYTLLEVVIAGLLLALAIIPAMNFVRASVETGFELEVRNQVHLLAVSKLEEQLSVAAEEFTEGSSNGLLGVPGLPSLRFVATRTTSSSAGGIADRLMVVEVTVWNDENASGTPESSELSATYATKVAKMAVYRNESI